MSNIDMYPRPLGKIEDVNKYLQTERVMSHKFAVKVGAVVKIGGCNRYDMNIIEKAVNDIRIKCSESAGLTIDSDQRECSDNMAEVDPREASKDSIEDMDQEEVEMVEKGEEND